MKFGAVEDLSKVDFKLPQDHLQTQKVLNGNPTKTKLYVGATQFGHKKWLGTYFPKGTKQGNFLEHYANLFNTIELNATHYRIFDASTIANWRDKVPSDFTFCPKWPQSITHRFKFKNHYEESFKFIESISTFQDKLGCTFIQLPPNYTANNTQTLLDFFQWLPKDIPTAIEFRHYSWFETNTEVEDFFDTLQELNISVCMSDTAGRRDVLPLRLTTKTAMVRFVGNELHSTDYERKDDWNSKLESWSKKGLERCYFFVHQPEAELAPQSTVYFSEKVNQAAYGTALPVPKRIDLQQSLF